MARAFRATTHGYTADLGAAERRLLLQLCADVMTLLEQRGQEGKGPATPSSSSDTPDEDPTFAHFRAELEGLGLEGPGEEYDGVPAPSDPVVARLLPAGSEDEEAAAQFRRLSEPSLRASKLADLRTARMLLESTPVKLTEEQAPIFGRALNDIRLTLSVRLGIESEEDAAEVQRIAAKGQVKDAESFMGEIYTFVTWLQETLFSAMVDMLPDEG